MKQSLFKLFFIFGMFVSRLASLHAADECNSFLFWGSDFSGVVNSTQNYTHSDSANGWGNDDTYYIRVTEPGEVTITVTGNDIRFSYDESACPNQGATPDAITGTYTFLAAGDFNLRVYRASWYVMQSSYTLNITFSPFTCNNFKVDDDKNQCSDACYTTITDAIDAASANQEILICDGTYNENLVVSKNGLTLKGESGNRANVVIQNTTAQPTVKLNGVNRVTLDTLSITDTMSRDALSISSYSQNTVLKNLLLNSGRDALHTNGGNGRLELYDSALEAGNDGIDIGGQINDGLLLSHLDITSTDRGLTSSGDLNGAVSILNSTITAGAEGVVLNNPVNATTTIDNLKVTAQNEGLSFKGELNGATTLSTVDITAGSNAVALYKKVNNGMSINGLDATTPNVGLLFNDELNGAITLQNMTISADSQAIFFAHDINNDLAISNSILTSTNNRGVYIGNNAYGDFTISRVAVTAKNEGLYFPYDKQISPVISDSNITSSDSDGIFTRSKSWTTFTLRDSCVKTEKSGHYGLNFYISESNSPINGNCFYATAVSELARAKSSGNDFLGNYWDGVGGNYTQNKISDTSGLGSCPHGCGGSLGPLAAWRFDECEWNGTPGEVQDSINAYHGTAQGGANTIDNTYQINRAGYFDGVDDVIVQDDLYTLLKATASLSFWIKTTQTGGSSPWTSPGVTGVEERGGVDDIFWGWLDTSGRIGISAKNAYNVKSTNSINDNVWHHVVLTRNHLSGEVKIYVDGTLDQSGMMPAGVIGNSFNRIGDINNTYSEHSFEGYLDEVSIYANVLDDTQVGKIYTNELAHKNYDGSDRAAVSCQPRPVADYHMDACNVSDLTWTLDSSGNGYTAIFGGEKLSLQEGEICSGVEILRESSISEVNAFKPGISTSALGDVGTIAFWYRSNQKWDASPGKMLVDSTKGDKYFFLGLLSNGKIKFYLEDNTDGDFQSESNTAFGFGMGEWVHLAFSWDFPAKSFKLYVNGADAALHLLNDSAGGSGRHIPSNLNELFIGDISENYTQNPSVYDGVRNSADGRFDEVKLFDIVLSVPEILNIYAREVLGFNFDDGVLRPCENCVYEPLYQGFFDAWDTTRDLLDRNISTKIVAQDFTLTLASLNETRDNYAEFNGTVCTQVVDALGSAYTSWTPTLYADTNRSDVIYNVPTSLKEARIRIKWQRDADVTCNAMIEDNSSLSSDDFAVRPEYYQLSSIGPYYAGEKFTLSAKANNALDIPAVDYNEIQNSSFRIEANETRMDCVVAGETASMESAVFTNGMTPVFDANYSGLAYDLDIHIYEINGSEFAFVDRDDTADAERLIHDNTISVTVVPYEINITQTDINASTNANWLYMAPVDDMNVTLHVKVQANDKTHAVLPDFNATCYAQNVDVAFDVDVINGDNALDMNYSAVTGTLVAGGTTLGDINKTVQIPAANFTDGVGEGAYAFNVDRQFDTPVAPFSVKGVAAGIISPNVAKLLNSDTTKNDGTIAFYYGRLRTKDVQTTTDVTNNVEIEVYRRDDLGASGWRQNSLNWYRSEDHTGAIFGKVQGHSVENDTQLSGSSDPQVATVIHDPAGGIVGFDISTTRTTPFNRVFHIDTDPWLYYVPEGFGGSYRYNAGTSDCSRHPCFNYKFMTGNTTKDISSGTFGGSDVTEKDRGVYEKKGVKVFR